MQYYTEKMIHQEKKETYRVVPFIIEDDGDGYTLNDERFIVIDPDTGEVLDDANGYGYTSANNAHRGYSFHRKPKAEREAILANKKKVKQWWNNHHKIYNSFGSWMASLSVHDVKRDKTTYPPVCQRVQRLEKFLQKYNIRKMEDGLTVELLVKYRPS